MRRDFFKFPRTPYLWWPLERTPKNDRVLDPISVREFLSAEIIVEEKIDGANLGFSVGECGEVRPQNRGSWLENGDHPQFYPMWAWLAQRESLLKEIIGIDRMFFGEWCYAVHSVCYDRLPDWFLGFDVYDFATGRFWSTQRRDNVFKLAGIREVPRLFEGKATLADLQMMLRSEQSRVGTGPIEGLYLRREGPEWLDQRAKLVRPEFLAAIEEHWSSRPLKHNKLVTV